MTDSPAYVRVMLVIGATVLAPLFEEMFFRGHVQTILVRLFGRTRAPNRAVREHSLLVGPTGRAVLDYASAAPASLPRPGGGARWAAVIASSVIFAVIHEPWTWPIIFILSLCLGYAYERTGNLWLTIFMHAIFNGVQTAIFLLGR
jgi:membrane protease YdiL (CAAX protease family)